MKSIYFFIKKAIFCCTLFAFILFFSHSVNAQSSLFSDDIWYFGAAAAGSPGSQGVMFKKNSVSGLMEARDASGVAKVSSYENTLSVSTPACDGSFVFYTQHDQVFNSNHEQMQNGLFLGNSSVADGLACCYMGNNKYWLFSIDASGFNAGLYYYIIDMSADNGLGSLSTPSNNTIETIGTSESIELVAIPGTSDEYWLIYHHAASRAMKVARVTNSGIGVPVSYTFPSTPLNTATNSYNLKSRVTSNTTATLALTSPATAGIHLFNFNPTTGVVTYNRHFSFTAGGAVYGVELSPSGNYLYAAAWNSSKIMQFRTSDGAAISTLDYNVTSLAGGHYGGGMKLAPDGKIYIAKGESYYLAVLAQPDNPMTTSNLLTNGLQLSVKSAHTLALSTGITPPAVDPVSATMPPTTTTDYATTSNITPVTKNVLENDDVNNGDRLYVASAFFTNPSDNNIKGTVSFDREDGTVTFTPDPTYDFTDGEQVYITYTAKDNGTPIPMCSSEQFIVTVKKAILTVSVPAPKEFDEGSVVSSIQVCLPDETVAPLGGLAVSLTAGSLSTASDTDYSFSTNSITINAGERCATFNVTLNNDLLVEHNETLIIEVSALNCATGSDQLIIKDKTIGDLEVVAIPASVAEGNNTAIFQIRFKEAGVTCTWDVNVDFEVDATSTAISSDHYTLSPASPITIGRGNHFVDISVATNANYVVEGNRELKLKITNVTPTTP